MPVAVIGPAGASLAESRQLSAGSERNLSCTKFASTCSGVPSSPDFTSRIASWIGGSKRFSWPPARPAPFSLDAAHHLLPQPHRLLDRRLEALLVADGEPDAVLVARSDRSQYVSA